MIEVVLEVGLSIPASSGTTLLVLPLIAQPGGVALQKSLAVHEGAAQLHIRVCSFACVNEPLIEWQLRHGVFFVRIGLATLRCCTFAMRVHGFKAAMRYAPIEPLVPTDLLLWVLVVA